MPASLQQLLSHWPHRLKGVGLDANTLLDRMASAPAGLTLTECRAITLSHPLGTITKHGLTHLASRDPLRYALTPKGHDYHQLLKHHNLIPQPKLEPA